jgi:hypothetical protein
VAARRAVATAIADDPTLIRAFDMAHQVEERLLDHDTPEVLTATRQAFANLKSSVLSPQPTGLERLLVQRLGLTWLELHRLEVRLLSPEPLHPVLAERIGDQRDRAHKRFLAAATTLARVRRLLAPPLRIDKAVFLGAK